MATFSSRCQCAVRYHHLAANNWHQFLLHEIQAFVPQRNKSLDINSDCMQDWSVHPSKNKFLNVRMFVVSIFLTPLYITVSSFVVMVRSQAIIVCRKRKKVMLVIITLLINTKHSYSQQQSDPNSDVCTSTIPQIVFNIVTGVCILQWLFQRTDVNCANLCRWHTLHVLQEQKKYTL